MDLINSGAALNLVPQSQLEGLLEHRPRVPQLRSFGFCRSRVGPNNWHFWQVSRRCWRCWSGSHTLRTTALAPVPGYCHFDSASWPWLEMLREPSKPWSSLPPSLGASHLWGEVSSASGTALLYYRSHDWCQAPTRCWPLSLLDYSALWSISSFFWAPNEDVRLECRAGLQEACSHLEIFSRALRKQMFVHIADPS